MEGRSKCEIEITNQSIKKAKMNTVSQNKFDKIETESWEEKEGNRNIIWIMNIW